MGYPWLLTSDSDKTILVNILGILQMCLLNQIIRSEWSAGEVLIATVEGKLELRVNQWRGGEWSGTVGDTLSVTGQHLSSPGESQRLKDKCRTETYILK